jgi:hypothetical protein
METLSQAPQPVIKCYQNNTIYQIFSPTSIYTSGRNLQSYNFERSLENFGGSFSFTVKEDVENLNELFMDKVQPLDIIMISEKDERVDFLGVVTTVSIGAIASNLNKVVTVSGKSIEWLFSYFNIAADIKLMVFENESANKTFKADLEKKQGTEGLTIKDVVTTSITAFRNEESKLRGTDSDATEEKITPVSNSYIGDLIDTWFKTDYVEATNTQIAYPISSNLFDTDKINVIDYIRKLFPSPIYEIFSYIDDTNQLKLVVREAPFDNPEATYYINPTQLTDYTLTRSCEEVYTAFMTYLEGTDAAPSFYMNIQAAKDIQKGYNYAKPSRNKINKYGYQILTCSLVGYNNDPDAQVDRTKLDELNTKLARWFSKLDEMYSGDLTIVNMTKERPARIGEWLGFAKGLYYVVSEKHSWMYGDNPMINYQVTRGGQYNGNNFRPIKKLSAVYKEFEQ